MIKNFIKEERFLLVGFLLLTLIIFGQFILNPNSFTLGFDYQNQHIYFYEEFHRLIKSGELPFWSWNLFLGTNFIGSKTYYMMGDPFAYLTLLFPVSKIIDAMMWVTIFKLLVAAISTSLLLKEMNFSKNIRWIPALMYAFSGWTFLFMEHPMYVSWFALLPLIFYAIEKYLNTSKVSLVILSTFVLLISNYYLFWSLCVFLIIYWPLRYFMKNKFEFLPFMKSSVKLVSCCALGCLMTLIFILPAALHTIQNSRLASESESLSFIWQPLKIYLDMIMRSFSPNFDATWDKALLFNTDDYRTNQLTLYSGVFSFICLFSYFLNFKRFKDKENILWLVLYLIIGGLLVTPYGSSLMHGLSEPTFRWTLLIILMNSILISKFLSLTSSEKWTIATSCGIIISLLLFLSFIGAKSYEYLQELQIAEIKMMFVTIVFVFIYGGILLLMKSQKHKLMAISILLLCELSFSATKTLQRYPDDSSNFSLNEKYSTEIFDYIHDLDDSFYRVFTPIHPNHYSTYRNLNLHYNYRGLSTYDSMYQFALADFLELIGANPTYWGFHILQPELHQMLGVKYYLISHEDELLVENLDELILIKEFENENLYTIAEPLPIGFTYSNFIPLSVAKEQKDTIDFLSTLILDDATYENLKLTSNKTDERDLFHVTNFTANSIEGQITITNDAYLFTSIPYDKGWSVKVNGEQIKTEQVQGGFIGFPLSNGTYTITFNYEPIGFKLGAILSCISFIGLIPILIIESRRK